VLFNVNSRAAQAIINNTGTNSFARFNGQTTANTATINNSGASSFTDFTGNSTAASATINNSGSLSITNFFNNSTAGGSTINNLNATSLVNFFDSASAGTARINNLGSGAFPSSVVSFFGTSTAANALITNGGANAQTFFGGNSTAASATIINTGAAAATVFASAASGGSAVLINANPTAIIDISQLTTAGTTAGSVAGNGTLFLGSKNLTVGSLNTSTEFSGVIQDGGFGGGIGGSLTKVGAGTLTLSGANTFSGGTTLQSGAITVASAQALGTGSFQLNGGTLQAGGPTRDINVRGNYTQTGGDLSLRIGGASVGQYDRLAVVGSANLGGRLSVNAINGFRPSGGDAFTVVTAAAGVNGTFAEVRDGLTQDTALTLTIDYLPNSVILSYLQGQFRPFALTPNQLAVAGALDVVVSDVNAADLIGFLNTLPTGNLPAAFDLIAPEEFGAIFEIARSAAKMQAFAVEHRLDDIHAASRFVQPAPEQGFSKDGKTSKELKEVVEPAPRFGVWVNGGGEFVNVGDTSNARGYDFDAGSVTLGLDYKFCEHFAAGVLFNYTRTRADFTGGGRLEADSFRGGLYASVFGGGAYLNAFVGGGYNDYDTKRNGLGGDPRGSTDGGEFNALIAAGYDAHFGNLTVGPIASYHYTYAEYDGFREHGSLAPLRIKGTEGESSRTNIGARATYDWHVGSVVISPEVRATWQHEFGDVEQATLARFAFGGPEFNVHSAEVGRDSLMLNAGFAVLFTPRFSAYAYYQGELARDNYDAHNVTVGGRLSF
jgi:autotransporter-associated beta strand protein